MCMMGERSGMTGAGKAPALRALALIQGSRPCAPAGDAESAPEHSPPTCVPGSRGPGPQVGAEAIRDLPRQCSAVASPVVALLREHLVEQIAPRGIGLLDQRNLPVPTPALHGALASGRFAGIRMRLEIDQPADPV